MRRVVKYTVPLIILLMIINCTKEPEQPHESTSFYVKVVALETDCGYPLIDFYETDRDRLSRITGENTSLRYYAYGLREEYKELGKEVEIAIKKISEEEFSLCKAMRPSFPALKVVVAKD